MRDNVWYRLCKRNATLESFSTYIGYKAILALSNVLPRSWQYAIAHVVADAHYLLDRPARESVKANLRAILPDAPEARIREDARWVFRSFGMYLCEFFGYRRFGPAFIDAHVSVQGRQHLDAARALGRGAILCSAHYSNWELGATTVAHLGYPITAIVQMHPQPRIHELFVQQRAARGVQVFPSAHGAKAALKALRRNGTVAMLGDRTTGGPVVAATLFGRRTLLPQGPWRIAYVSGAPILPAFIHREFNNNYTLQFGAPIVPPAAAECERNAAMCGMAQAWAACLEARLRANPCQWAAFRPFWDSTPPGPQLSTTLENAKADSSSAG